MVILMSDEKPINAMYGSKMKLDLDKLKNRNKDKEPVEEEPVEEVQQTVDVKEEVIEEVVDEPAEEAVEEEVSEEVVDDPAEEAEVEEVSEEAVEETTDEDAEVEEEEVADEPAEEVKQKPSKEDKLSKKLAEKDKKLFNQSSELNYLTNKVIPKLKKENAELKGLKKQLTKALEKSTRKYYNQLDINADLSDQIAKIGADGAVNKVRADKLESEINTIKDDYEAKIAQYKEKLDSANNVDLENENKKLADEVKDLKDKLSESRKENIALSEDVDKLRAEIIEIGNYKEEVDTKFKKEISGYKEEISTLKTQLKVKESSYDKLSNESNKTISDLRKQVSKLEEQAEKSSKGGLFNRFK